MGERRKFTISLIVTVIIVAFAILTTVIIQFSSFVDRNAKVEIDGAVNNLSNTINNRKQLAYIISLFLSTDDEIIAAVADESAEGIFSRMADFYELLGIDVWMITDNQGYVMAQYPSERVGFNAADLVFGSPTIRTALTGRHVTTLERAAPAGVSAVSGTAIYHGDGRLLGVMFIGYRISTDAFIYDLLQTSSVEFLLSVADRNIVSSFLPADGTPLAETAFPEGIYDEVVENIAPLFGRFNVVGHSMEGSFVPLEGFEGLVPGVMFVGHFLAERNSVVVGFITVGGIVTVIILLLSYLFLYNRASKIHTQFGVLESKVYEDKTTGIPNRRYFDENVDSIIKNISRYNGKLSLIIGDIDFFKLYNDSYGHNAGDECLRKVAACIRENISRTGDFVARYGGEEFVVVLPNADEEGAKLISEKILESIRGLNIPHDKSAIAPYITISLGVVTGIANHIHTATDYVELADEMLYASKRSGRNKSTTGTLAK